MKDINPTKLYIIGNGFDLFHDLPTKYEDFRAYILRNKAELQDQFESYFDLSSQDDSQWNNFEQDLATFSSDTFLDHHNFVDEMSDDFERKDVYGLEDEMSNETDRLVSDIKEHFEKWIAEIELCNVNPKIVLDPKAKFLTFNYTLTLEQIYTIPKNNIFHIHGSVDMPSESLIFGHCQDRSKYDSNEFEYHPFSTAEEYSRYPIHAFQKPVKEIITKHKEYFNNLKNVEEIFTIGHSLNVVDLPYIKEIITNCPNAKWIILSNPNRSPLNKMKILIDLGIKKEDITTETYAPYNVGTLFPDNTEQ
jgi:hypothetical protein